MPQMLYCWRCQMEVPMLSEEEWADVGSLLYHAPEKALSTYNEMTDFGETNPNALAHHRAALFGPPCEDCDRPLRSPKAKFCASCGTPKR